MAMAKARKVSQWKACLYNCTLHIHKCICTYLLTNKNTTTLSKLENFQTLNQKLSKTVLFKITKSMYSLNPKPPRLVN